MKNLRKFVLLGFSLMFMASCVNDNLSEPWDSEVNKVLASVADQAKAVESSIEVVEALQDAVKAEGVEIAGVAELLGQHVDELSAGMSLSEGSLATLELQKQLASILGAAQAELYFADALDQNIQKSFALVEKSVNIWLGEILVANYPAALAEARVGAIAAEFEKRLADQELTVEALKSDIEAGLRKDENPAEITGLSVSVAKASQEVETLAGEMVLLAAEVEEEYKAALKTITSDPASFDGESLSELNSKVATKAEASDRSITDLAADVKECQETLANLQQRLEVLEGNVNELLGMIQSVTFVSDYPDDRAVAYYRMSSELNVERAAEGKMDRVPENTFDLNFLIRPAAVADALDQMWNSGQKDVLSIIGYYAHQIQQASADYKFINFEVSNVVSSRGKGLLTVTVDNAFSDDFYFREVGAKLALSVESGQNNCTSKFVEIAPMDITGKVYAESLTLTPTSLSIQNGDTYQLEAVVYPANVTDKGCTWNDYDSEYVSVDANGNLSATAVGKSQVIVYANATDEFGRQLSATCDVDVTAAVKVVGSGYVEVGNTVTLDVESPNYIDPQYIKWSLEGVGANGFLNLEKNADGSCNVTGKTIYFQVPAGGSSGAKSEYQPVTVVCTIEGATPVVVRKQIMVVAVQPKAIAVDGLQHDQNKLLLKKDKTFQLTASIQPDAVNRSWFGLIYQSQQPAVVSVDFRSGLMTANAFGTTNVEILVNDVTSESYFYPKRATGDYFKRVLSVTVEPYWVKSMTLPVSYKMTPDATATLTPEWTSDVDGKLPSDQTVTWTSSDPTVVSVDANTGALLALKEGTATITATTAGVRSVPEGQEQISSSCLVTVETPTVPINIGDYYYSDGTWSTIRDNNKTVIGIVFAKVDATGSDLMLRDACPTATHGLVVSIKEYNENMGYVYYQDAYFKNNGYDLSDDSKILGYTYTYYMNSYAHYKGDGQNYGTHYAELFRSDVGVVAKHTHDVSSPASPWYVPSCFEMLLMYDAKTAVNSSLAAIGATQISNAGYWMSNSVRLTKSSSWWDPDHGKLFDMSSGQLSSSIGQFSTESKVTANYPVRVVLAF